jgi:hypothetical protein
MSDAATPRRWQPRWRISLKARRTLVFLLIDINATTDPAQLFLGQLDFAVLGRRGQMVAS